MIVFQEVTSKKIFCRISMLHSLSPIIFIKRFLKGESKGPDATTARLRNQQMMPTTE